MNDKLIGLLRIFGIDTNKSYHPDLEIENPLIAEINKKNNISPENIFRNKSLEYFNTNIKNNLSFDNVYATELNDSIQNSSSFLNNINQYKTKLANFDGNYLDFAKAGAFNYKNGNPYFTGFNSDVARLIHKLGMNRGLSENLIATLIEAGWRETNLGENLGTAATGVWQFDKKAGTSSKYLKWLKLKNLKDSLENLFTYLLDEYMPSRDDGVTRTGYKNVWTNPKSTLELLAKYFLIEVEAPKERNNPDLLNRTFRAVRTLVGRK